MNDDLRQLIMGDIFDDGSLIDYTIPQSDDNEEQENEDCDLKQDDDDPIDDPNISILKETFQHTYTKESIEMITNHLRLGLQYHAPSEYKRGMSYRELLKSMKSNHTGGFNSVILHGISEAISYIFEQKNLPYIKCNEDGIDWKVSGIEGDAKFSILNDPDRSDFTGNGSSNKRGYYFLVAIRFDNDVPMKNIIITHMYVGIIATKYMANIRRKGKSDRSKIQLQLNLFHRLHTLYGVGHPKKTWVAFEPWPCNNMDSSCLFD